MNAAAGGDTLRALSRAVCCAVALVTSAPAAAEVPAPQTLHAAQTPQPAPDFELVDLDGALHRLSDYRGKVVVLNFWATWCPPCREQMPIVQKLADDPSLKDDLVILSVNADDVRPDRQAKVETYLNENGYRFTTIMDDGRALSAYGVSNLPTLFIIDPQGRVAHRDMGVHPEAKLRKVLGRVMR